jgi:hypothetical protein
MSKERASIPWFSRDKDEFCMWFLQANAYTFQFGYANAMKVMAEVDLPATQGPGETAAQQVAVERNMKAASQPCQIQ